MIPAGDDAVEHWRLAGEGPAGAGGGSDEDTAAARGMKARRGQRRPERARARRAEARASERADRSRSPDDKHFPYIIAQISQASFLG
jgi:hypothetical protein